MKQDISSAKTKFSMESPVEETDTLIALHNMDETGLRTTLKLGAWPSPSIAIVKAKQGHSKFGEYSAIFPRSTIDPETNSQNKVYGSDAWTPTRGDAQVEYEVNYDKKLKAESHINELSKKIAGGIFAKSSTISSIVDDVSTDDTEALARRLAGNDTVKAAYLADKGETLEPVYKAKEFDNFGNDTLQAYIYSVGAEKLEKLADNLLFS